MVTSNRILNMTIIKEELMKNLGYYGRRNVCGERVRMARLAKRISQETLAAKMQTKGVNIAQDAISNIESGARLVMDYELRAFASVFLLHPRHMPGVLSLHNHRHRNDLLPNIQHDALFRAQMWQASFQYCQK